MTVSSSIEIIVVGAMKLDYLCSKVFEILFSGICTFDHSDSMRTFYHKMTSPWTRDSYNGPAIIIFRNNHFLNCLFPVISVFKKVQYNGRACSEFAAIFQNKCYGTGTRFCKMSQLDCGRF